MIATVLRAGHSHLYPGARLQADGPLETGADVLIEFADLAATPARVERCDGAEALLAVAAHRTSRGTNVAARRWVVEPLPGDDGSPRRWRVRRRAPTPR